MRNSTKQMYKYGQGTNIITMSFPEIGRSYTTKDLDKDQVSLNEALINGDNLEFVGCIRSYFQAKIHDANANLKDNKIIVPMDLEGERQVGIVLGGGHHEGKGVVAVLGAVGRDDGLVYYPG